MSNGFIDLDSTYRNRNEWPKSGQFEVNIAQSGTKQKGNAEDPVSLAEPLAVWSCNALTTSQPTTFQIYGEIAPPNLYGNVGYSQNGIQLTLVFTDQYNNSVQQEDNYYVGLIFWNVTNTKFSRITSYKYIGNDENTPPNYSLALITVSSEMSFNFGDNFVITDDSDLTRSNYPLLFVPNGKAQDNAYLNYILYCENNNDYRDITYYNGTYKYLITKPWTGISSYQELGNFCVRKIPPIFPEQLESSRFVSNISTPSIINVVTTGVCSLKIFITPSQQAIEEEKIPYNEIPYKYDFLRIRPYRTTDIDPSIVAVGQFPGGESQPTWASYSSNAINWQNSSSAIFQNGFCVANNGPNSHSLIWVSGGQRNPSSIASYQLAYSVNGKDWAPSTNQPFNGVNCACYSVFYYMNRFIAGGYNPNISISMSYNGDTWTDNTVTNPKPLDYVYAIATFKEMIMINHVLIGGKKIDGTKTLLIGPGLIGTEWIFNAITPDPFNGIPGQCNGIAADGNKWVAVGKAGTSGENIYYSTNILGTTCAPSDNNPFSGGEGMCVANNGDYWVAGGTSSSIGQAQIAKSADGITWIVSTNIPGASSIRSIIWNRSYWIATGEIGAGRYPAWLATSVDGIIWTQVNSDSFRIGYGISVYNENQNYNTYTGIYSLNNKSQSRQIISYYNDGNIATFEVYPPFDITTFGTEQYTIEVEPFSYNNAVPFSYNGTLVQQNICYEFELLQIILPNFTLKTGFGSKIAFYPYIYVELSNVSSSGARLKNMMHSNNPNAVRMLFKVPIYDVSDPETTPFVRLVAIGMIHTMKFKPDDNLFFTVLLPNGDVFDTIQPEYYSPSIPNFDAQVSALFRYKAVI
jgi:hypothetical protein